MKTRSVSKLKVAAKKRSLSTKRFLIFSQRNYSLYIAAFGVLSFAFVFFTRFPHSTKEVKVMSFSTVYNSSPDIELGDQQTKKVGKDGKGLISYQSFWSVNDKLFQANDISRNQVASKVIQSPESKVIVMGTKKYQYMWCSDGTYYEYTDAQFKNSNTGFTHKSLDDCAPHGAGSFSQLSNTAPSNVQPVSSQSNLASGGSEQFYFPNQSYAPKPSAQYQAPASLYAPTTSTAPPTEQEITSRDQQYYLNLANCVQNLKSQGVSDSQASAACNTSVKR